MTMTLALQARVELQEGHTSQNQACAQKAGRRPASALRVRSFTRLLNSGTQSGTQGGSTATACCCPRLLTVCFGLMGPRGSPHAHRGLTVSQHDCLKQVCSTMALDAVHQHICKRHVLINGVHSQHDQTADLLQTILWTDRQVIARRNLAAEHNKPVAMAGLICCLCTLSLVVCEH